MIILGLLHEPSLQAVVPSWQQDNSPTQKVPVGQQVDVWQPVRFSRVTDERLGCNPRASEMAYKWGILDRSMETDP